MTTPRVNVPLAEPHVSLVVVVAIAVGPPVLLMLTEVENIQPLTSLTSIECGPAAKLV